jgi:2-C-methyl-D-erythritol 4-phosphate cytidylyltransferase
LALENGISQASDDFFLVSYFQLAEIKILPGCWENIKITTPLDLLLARLLAGQNTP